MAEEVAVFEQKDEKYLVISRKWLEEQKVYFRRNPNYLQAFDILERGAVPDAVVIRKQDSFAPFALEAYANNIASVVTVAHEMGLDDPRMDDLKDVADYFHSAAQESYDMVRKLPD